MSRRPFEEIAYDLCHHVEVRICEAAENFVEVDCVEREEKYVAEGFYEDYGSYLVVASCHRRRRPSL